MTTCTHTCVCLHTEGERPEENKNESTTDSNFSFVNQRNKSKLRPLPFFVIKKVENYILGNLYPWSNDRQIKWLRSHKTSPDLSLPPTVRLDTLGDFRETSQIEVGAVKIASAQKLREGPQDFTRAVCMAQAWLKERRERRGAALALSRPGRSPSTGGTCCQRGLGQAGENWRWGG